MIVDWSESLNMPADRSKRDDDARYVVAIGSFDGVHRGHQALIEGMRKSAKSLGAATLIVTFEPLPREVFAPDGPPSRLTDISARLRLFEGLGVERVLVLRFSQELASESASDFLLGLLGRYKVVDIWAGEDFAFGHDRRGDLAFLRAMVQPHGFQVHVVKRIAANEWKDQSDSSGISSSLIRRAIEAADIRGAERLLGRPPSFHGVVIHGAGRGRELGYPTANLRLPPNLVTPASGIFAAWAAVNSQVYGCALSIGYDPTFGENPLSFEAHLLDFDEDIYGRPVTVYLVEHLRREKRFSSIDALISQMRQDVIETRKVLAETARPSTFITDSVAIPELVL